MDIPQVGKIEQLTSNRNFMQLQYPEAKDEQIDQINKRLDVIEQHVNLLEEILLEFHNSLSQNKIQSSV